METRPMRDHPERSTRDLLARLALACLVGHVAMTLFSAYAFSTFLAGPPPAWLQSPANQAILRAGWRFGGPTCVVLGALAGLLHCASRLGSRTALVLFAAAFSISLASELTGTGTGYPFGPYAYTSQLGWKFFGLVPFNIPTSWFYMLYCALAIVGRIARSTSDARAKWRWAIAAGFVLTAWDVSMDPAMVRTTHWLWHLPAAEGRSAVERAFVSDAFYGMPLSNWLGWLLTGIVVARVMLELVPPARWAHDVSPSRFPLVLYAVNGVLPIAICLRHDLTWAWVLGTVAMALPLALALRGGVARSRAGTCREASPLATAGD